MRGAAISSPFRDRRALTLQAGCGGCSSVGCLRLLALAVLPGVIRLLLVLGLPWSAGSIYIVGVVLVLVSNVGTANAAGTGPLVLLGPNLEMARFCFFDTL